MLCCLKVTRFKCRASLRQSNLRAMQCFHVLLRNYQSSHNQPQEMPKPAADLGVIRR
jgi:hypothetical protein